MEKHIICFSGGKDSTAMLLLMLEKGMQVDEIIFLDTTIEFPQMYNHLKKVEKFTGRKITILKPKNSYKFMMFDYIKKKGKSKGQKGYGWSSARLRWCTRYFKQGAINRYLKEKYGKDVKTIEYVGIAFDEPERLEKNKNKSNLVYPLAEWKITEKMALDYCYSKGFDWEGLYKKFDRVSCWCCPLQALKELRVLYDDFPQLWKILKEWDKKNIELYGRKFRADYSVEELEKKFKKEYKQKKLF